MTDRISAVTRGLLTLSLFFVCATIGAGLALFTGWPVAILSGIVGFVVVQQVSAGFARRRDKRATAREIGASAQDASGIRNLAARDPHAPGRTGRADRKPRRRPGKEDRRRTEGAGNPDARFRRQDFAQRRGRGAGRTAKGRSAARPAPISRRWMARARCWKPSAPAWKKTASICTCSPSSACRSASCAL